MSSISIFDAKQWWYKTVISNRHQHQFNILKYHAALSRSYILLFCTAGKLTNQQGNQGYSVKIHFHAEIL